MSSRVKTSGDLWPLIVIATLSSTPARRIFLIADRRRSWIETPAKECQPVGPRRFTRECRRSRPPSASAPVTRPSLAACPCRPTASRSARRGISRAPRPRVSLLEQNFSSWFAMPSVLPWTMASDAPHRGPRLHSPRSIYAALAALLLVVFVLSAVFFARAIRVEEGERLAQNDAIARSVAASIEARQQG